MPPVHADESDRSVLGRACGVRQRGSEEFGELFPGHLAGGEGKFQVTAVGNLFEGLNAVKRQQKVYQILNEHIASGAIHAVSMRLLTTAEHEAT